MTRRPTPATVKTTICAVTVRSVLDLSTAHLPEHLGNHGQSDQDGVTAYELPYSWLMWIPADPQTHADLPPEVLAIQRHADPAGDLSTWDW
jgi:hypothetical protein